MIWIYGFFACFVYLLLPQDAWAWGPGAHLNYALYAIAQTALLAPVVRNILKKYQKQFLYGTIAADIIFGKKFAGDLYHCHHWEVAMPLLEKTNNDEERAFIWGYLGHLAVDTVAHNYYVPQKIIASFKSLTLRHTYWEMRFDEKMDQKVWKYLAELAQEDYSHLDRFLEKNLKRTLFNFAINKKIFNSLILFQRMEKWQRASKLMARRSPHSLKDSEVRYCRGLCYDVLVEFLQDPESSRARQVDPSGKLKLLYAKEMVRDLRRYRRRQLLSASAADHFTETIKQKLRDNVYKPGDLPLITDALQ